ncbi:asparaginase-domain-containing protein [Melampsora americana]|nr:asparaginase-domain-containing protein [Melampsora americana]
MTPMTTHLPRESDAPPYNSAPSHILPVGNVMSNATPCHSPAGHLQEPQASFSTTSVVLDAGTASSVVTQQDLNDCMQQYGGTLNLLSVVSPTHPAHLPAHDPYRARMGASLYNRPTPNFGFPMPAGMQQRYVAPFSHLHPPSSLFLPRDPQAQQPLFPQPALVQHQTPQHQAAPPHPPPPHPVRQVTYAVPPPAPVPATNEPPIMTGIFFSGRTANLRHFLQEIHLTAQVEDLHARTQNENEVTYSTPRYVLFNIAQNLSKSEGVNPRHCRRLGIPMHPVLVIYTGGTIGMLSGSQGYSPLPGYLTEHLRSQPRFHDPRSSSLGANSRSVDAFRNWQLNSPTVTPPESRSGSRSRYKCGSSPQSEDGEDLNTETESASHSNKLKVITDAGPRWLESLVMPESPECPKIRYAILEYERLIDSSEIEISDYLQICHSIQSNYHAFDAFVILHGTDTMSYTASAISFLFENLGKSVILTGAQIPLSNPRNDAVDNLLGALQIGGSYLIPEVSLYFNHQLWRGNRTVKFSSVEFDAFKSFNLEPLVKVGCNVDVRWDLITKPTDRQAFRVHNAMCANVAVLRIFPSISPASVRAFLQPPLQGIVLETFGAGNAPKKPQLLQAFKEASDRGVVIVNVTQCTKGTVSSDIYETGRALAANGIVGGRDMTTECALAKLGYLLSKPGLSVKMVRELIGQPLRGELTLPARVQFEPSHDRLRWLISHLADTSHDHRAQVQVSVNGKEEMSSPPIPTDRTPTLPRMLIEPVDSDALPDYNPKAEPTVDHISQGTVNGSADKNLNRPENYLLPYALVTAAGRADDSLARLISAGARAGALNKRASTGLGQTPLHIAAFHGRLHNLEILLDHGASVHLRDDFGHTPLYYALQKRHHACAEALEKAGGHLIESEKTSRNASTKLFFI